MKQVFIKAYGWVDVIKQDGKYSLCLLKSGTKICFNTLGLDFRELLTNK